MPTMTSYAGDWASTWERPFARIHRVILIGRVMNVGDLTDGQTRVYETNAYLPYLFR